MFKTNAYINNLVNFITGSLFAPKLSILHVHRDKFVTNKLGVAPATKLTLNQVSGLALGNQTETILECDSQAGELNMYSRKFTTKNFICQVGEKLSQVRDKISNRRLRSTKQIAEFTPKVVVTSSQSTCSVKQLPHVASTAPKIGEKFMHRIKKGLIHQTTKGVKKMACQLVALLNTIAPVAAINNVAIMRTLKVVLMAGVIIGAGLVVLPVLDAQADTINYQSSVTGNISQDVTEPTGNAGSVEVVYTFEGIGTPRTEHSGIELDITVVEEESTARLGADFTIPENQTVSANAPNVVNTVRIMLLGDTFKEGDEKIVLMLTLPADVNGVGLEFKQFVGSGGGSESKSIKLTFNVTDEASDTEIDPIAFVPSSSDDLVIEFQNRGANDGALPTLSAGEPAVDGAKMNHDVVRFNAVSGSPAPGFTKVPVNITVLEGPSRAILGEDFTIPANQTLDFSTVGATNSIEVTVSGDAINEETEERILLWISLPENLPVYFQSHLAGAAKRKAIRVRFDINDDNADSGAVPTSPVTPRTITLATESAGGFFGGDIPFTVTINPRPASPVSVPLYVWGTSGNVNGLTLPGTDASRAPSGDTGEPQDVFYLTVGTSGKATGVIRVPDSGLSGSVRLFIQKSIEGYTASSTEYNLYSIVPNTRFLSIPIAQAPGTVPEISISGPTSSVNEGTVAEFTLTANNAPSADTTIAVNVVDFAGRTGADYVTDGPMYTVLKSGQTTATLEVQTINDNVEGVDGFLMATITSGTGYTIKSGADVAYADVHEASTTVTPSEVTVSATPTSVEEGNMATYTISRGIDNTGNLDVAYIFSETGDVIDGEDTQMFATILDGQTSVPVSVLFKTSGTDYDTNDGVTLTIQSIQQFAGARYRVGASSNVKIGVTNAASAPLPVITVTGVNITEGGATADITFSLDKVAPAGGVTITAAVDTGNSVALENTDFTLSTKTVSIASGNQNGSITVTAVSDSLYEGADETFTLTLTATGANFSDTSNNSGTVSNTIMESDKPPVITVSSPVQADNPGTFNFVVTKTGNTTQSVSIAYEVATSLSTATVGTDFNLGTPGPLVIAVADSSGVIPITILTDATSNETEETIVLTLTLTHGIFEDGTADGTNTGMATAILTDLLIASIATNYSEVADSDYFTYNVTLDPAPSGSESVTVNLTLPDTSSFPLTYENVGTLVFATERNKKIRKNKYY